MMLDYLNQEKLGNTAPNLSEDEIAAIMNTDITGTHLRNISNINGPIASASPSLEFVPEFETHNLDDIRNELEAGLPVTVWILTSDGSSDYLHSVVITGTNEETKQISYNDPTYGTETVSQTKFLDMWGYPGARMIKAKIGRITTESMEKYLSREVTK